MTDHAKELLGQGKFDRMFLPCLPPAAKTVPGPETLGFKSRKEIEEGLMTTLRDGDVNLIGIYGMGGLGKTTMAERIRNSVLIENVFQEVALTVVSQQADMSKIQTGIAELLGLELKDVTSQARAQKLHSRLSDGTKRILVILDDVWEGLELEKMGILCASKGSRCTVLITSRNKDVLDEMSVQKIYEIKVLSEDDAWFLFRKKADVTENDTDLNSIAKQVMKECGGLPLALAAIGATLKGKNLRTWNDTLGRLRKVHQNSVIGKVYGLLKLSYELLPSEEDKSIFLLCCLFPEDSDIPLEKLTYFSMGLEILEDIDTLEEARNRMCSVIHDVLKSRSLLLDSDKEEHVRIHDLFRDVCIQLAREKGYISGDDRSWISSSQRVGIELLSESRFPNLRLLSLSKPHEGFEFGSAFLEGIEHLHVLCITKYSGLTSVPPSLVNLKTLLLDSCWGLKSISVVGKLRNLEILICRHCESIEELPAEMKGLNQLKLLELTYCKKLQSIGRGIIASLVALEELKMYNSFNRWEAEHRKERENAALTELAALTNLKLLEIKIDDPALASENMRLSSNLEIFTISIASDYSFLLDGCMHLKKISLWLEGGSFPGDWIERQLLREIEGLSLSGDGANNVDLAKCQNIQSLALSVCRTVKRIITASILVDDATATPFPLIENLILFHLPELEKIYDGPIPSCSFQKLSHIKITCCHRLRNLGQLSIAAKDCLPQLEQLKIWECEMMEQVFLWNDTEAGQSKISIESQRTCHVITQVFPKLEEVKLVSLPNLTTFYQGIEGIEFPLLTKLQIEECPKMKIIIMASNEKSNSGEIASSTADQYIDDTLQPQKVSIGSSLESLVINHNPFCGHEIPSSHFNGLEELRINGYKSHEGNMSLFTLSMAANLASLRKLCIFGCDEMIEVIEDEQQQERILEFPKLEELSLGNLPKLVSFCGLKCEVKLPLLRKVEIERCPNMENFSMGLVGTPKLEAFTTDLTTYVGVGVDVEFNSLKKLEIRYNENPLNDDKISVSLFNGLEKLEFYWCKGCTSLLSSSAIGNLVNLRVLEIKYSDEMLVNVIEHEEEEEKVVSGSAVFPKLEELHLYKLPKLVSFCGWKCDVQFPSLTKLKIKQCPNMESFSMGFVAAPSLKFFCINREYIKDAKELNGALQQCLAQKERTRRF